MTVTEPETAGSPARPDASTTPRPADCSLAALVATRVARHPDALAVGELHGPGRRTWAELQDEARRCATALAGLGVERGDMVLVMLSNKVPGWVAQLGIATLGAVDVPVNSAYVGSWLDHVVATTGARVAVVDELYLAQWEPILAGHDDLRHVLVAADGPVDGRTVGGTTIGGLRESVEAAAVPTDPVALTAGDLATVMWTSGTTGKSKGVLMPWGQWWGFCVSSTLLPDDALGEDDVRYQPWPTFHLGGRDSFYRQAVFGGSTWLRDGFSATDWFDDVRRCGATWSYLVGAGSQLVHNTPRAPGERDSALRFVLSGPAAAVAEDLCERFGIEYYTSYGMTEINNPFRSAGYRITKDNWTSCGTLHPSRTVRVVGPDGTDVAPGEPGELWVLDERDRDCVARGYLGPPELTDACWYDGWFHTGDLFRFDVEGRYYFLDRLKDAVRRGGENISSMEVEAALNTHPDVAESAVVPVAAEFAEDEVAAFVVMREGAVFDPVALHGHAVATIPRFARPRFLIPIDGLPRTPSMKIRKVELRERGVLDGAWDARKETGA
ncbi:AMP-binding protein [Pseudonocardia pini]|uniref:AMP-binding protein n=1 Tax=Pseudonocardia pini TaxID=2758030 RepID=UPI0015F02141|nr:AMP-binding protein [Pseudonocardia pini]